MGKGIVIGAVSSHTFLSLRLFCLLLFICCIVIRILFAVAMHWKFSLFYFGLEITVSDIYLLNCFNLISHGLFHVQFSAQNICTG